MLRFPEPGYFGRMRIYLAEMFPVPLNLAFSFLVYISIVAFMHRVNNVLTPIDPLIAFVGIWSLFAMMLIFRLMDDLKDREIDGQLFGDRPLPSGKVFESDITFSLLLAIALCFAANIWAGPALWVVLCILGYSLLMFKHFFMPDFLRKNLLVTLATHNLISLVIYFYVVVLFSVENDFMLNDLHGPSVILIIAMYWAIIFALEIARKIRSREEENAYMTYSQIFGPFGAVLVAAGAQTIAFTIGLYFYWTLSLSGIFLAILSVGYGITIWGHARFVSNPNPITSKLKPFAVGFTLLVLIAQILEHTILV